MSSDQATTPPDSRSPDSSTDGTYRYRWTTRFGRHTVFFFVKDGVITTNPANENHPVKHFDGKTLAEFVDRRMKTDWLFCGNDSLHQITVSENRDQSEKQSP